MRRTIICLLCASAPFPVSAITTSPSGADAAEAQSPQEQILVTAQRREEKLLSVPISMTAISARDIADHHVQGLQDYLALTPNVSFVNNGSRDRMDISIRGISNQLDPAGNVRPAAYGFYIDDFNVSAITSNPQIVDMARIEILRGPQGTYFGRNAEGGAINIATQQPVDRWYEEAAFDYSSFNTRNYKAILNVPIATDLALRIAGEKDISDGNIRNINPTGGGNDHDYGNIRGELRYHPGSRFDIDGIADYSSEKTGMRDGVPTGFLTATWRAVYYQNQPGNVADPDGVGFYPANDDRVNFNTAQSVGTRYYWGRVRAHYRFDTMTLTAIAGYGHSDVFNRGDVDGSSHDYFNEDGRLKRHTSSAELRLQSDNGSRLEWNVGANYGEDVGSTSQITTYGVDNLFHQPPGFQITTILSRSTDSYAGLFGQATYHFSPRVDLTVGGRYSHEHVTGRFLNLSNEVVTNDEPHRAASFDDFSPKATFRYRPDGGVTLYATASKGFKTGGVQATQAAIANSYKPETLWNFESGVKLDLLDHRLQLDMAGFYERWHDVQQSERFQYFGPNGALLFIAGIANAARAHSVGAEGSATFRATSRITLAGHAGYSHAVYDRFPDALVDGAVIDASGKPLIDAPRWTGGASGTYRLPIASDLTGFGQLNWNYRGRILSSTYALRYPDSPFVSPSYNNVDLQVGIERGDLRLMVYVDNLLDAHYYSNAFEKAFYSGVQVIPSYRRVGVSLTIKHG